MNWRWLIWLVYVVAWTWALLLPNPDEWARALLGLSTIPPGVDVGVRQNVLDFMQSFGFAKGLHITAYAGLAILSGWLRVPRSTRWLLIIFMSLHGMGTEFMQNFEPSRHPSWRDVGLDHLGIALGLLIAGKWWTSPTTRTLQANPAEM